MQKLDIKLYIFRCISGVVAGEIYVTVSSLQGVTHGFLNVLGRLQRTDGQLEMRIMENEMKNYSCCSS